MKIEIIEEFGVGYYREAISVAYQSKAILKDYNIQVWDLFKFWACISVASTALSLIWLFVAYWISGFNGLTIAALSLCALCGVCGFICLAGLYQNLRALRNSHSQSTLVLDENGVELDVRGKHSVRINWDNLAVVKIGRESINFLSFDSNGIHIGVPKKYESQIMPWVRMNHPEIDIA